MSVMQLIDGMKKQAPLMQYWFFGHWLSAVQPPGLVQIRLTHCRPQNGQSCVVSQ